MPGEIYHIRPGRDGSHPTNESPRRLAAILAADISGYSRLMAMDEEGTHARVKRHRRELIDPAIIEYHGRLVKSTGDGFLAMFDSPVEAVRCAIVIQQSMVGRNAALARDQWIQYRIGVNLGDVIVEPEDIYGDGVNIAARLEGIADPETSLFREASTSRSSINWFAAINRSAIARSRTSRTLSESTGCCPIPPPSLRRGARQDVPWPPLWVSA